MERSRKLYPNSLLYKAVLLLSFLILSSCSDGDGRARPSLDADDLWDRMAADRQAPLPTAPLTDDVSLAVASQPPGPAPHLRPDENAGYYLRILNQAQGRYEKISAAIAGNMKELSNSGLKNGERDILWRTIQLHLSRLTSLNKDINKAMAGFARTVKKGEKFLPHDVILLDKNLELTTVISQDITRITRNLNEQ